MSEGGVRGRRSALFLGALRFGSLSLGVVLLLASVGASEAEAQRRRRRPPPQEQAEAAGRSEASAAPEDESTRAARTYFVRGAEDVEAGRWADAIENFRRSYEISRTPSALFNLALAYRSIGHHRDSRDTFDQLLRDHSDAGDELIGEARRYRTEEAERVAVLSLAGLDSIQGEAQPTIHFDGTDVEDSGERPLRIETDAGAHSLVVELPEFSPFLWDGELADGAREEVEVIFTPLSSGDVASSPVFWGILAASLVVLAAGAAVGGYFLHEDAQLVPYSMRRFEL